ncbi:MAG TPA: VOC family protein [Gaiellaceae bacterium]|nr:VOC family protein [Gaiellaceae bacterium]
MATYLHTMLRITDPDQSRVFYEALGFTFSRDMDIVRNGQLEATNYFYSLGDDENVLELTFNHDGRTYDFGSGYGHIAIGVDDLDETLSQLKEQGIDPERETYRVREGGSRICFVRDPDGCFATLSLASLVSRANRTVRTSNCRRRPTLPQQPLRAQSFGSMMMEADANSVCRWTRGRPSPVLTR